MELSEFFATLDEDSKLAALGACSRVLQGKQLSQLRAKHRLNQRVKPSQNPAMTHLSLDTRNGQDEHARGQAHVDRITGEAGNEVEEDPIAIAERYLSAQIEINDMLNVFDLTDFQKPQSFEDMLTNMAKNPKPRALDQAVLDEHARRGHSQERIEIVRRNQAELDAKYMEADAPALLTMYNDLRPIEDYGIDNLPKEDRIDVAHRTAEALRRNAKNLEVKATRMDHFVTCDLLVGTAGQLDNWANRADSRRMVKAVEHAATTA